MSKKYYLLFDGRANYDIDRASILETIGEMSLKRACAEVARDWEDTDAVLVEYDVTGDELIDERIIGDVETCLELSK